MEPTRDYLAIAAEYCSQVIDGTIPACRWVRLACQRQVNDLKRPASESWPWHFSAKHASRVCKIAEMLPHIKGRWKTRCITLEPHQIFRFTTIFGWVDAEGFRRFLDVYIEMPRKSAKSTETAVAALACMTEGEPGAEIYALATKKDQARIVFDTARRMVMKEPGIRRRFGLEVEKHRIFVEDGATEFKALSSDEDGLDGLNIHFASLDELHAHKSRAVHDVVDSATGSRRQPLKWRITTAGFNQQGVCYEQREYVTKILEGVHSDDRYFGIIYSIDGPVKNADGTITPGDDWRLEATWKKANPNYGVSVLPSDIAALARKAIQSARSQTNFLTKRLDVWCNSSEAFYNMDAWLHKCARPQVTLAEFEGKQCWIGLDLSSKCDITAKVRIFRRIEKDEIKGKIIERPHYYVFCEHYLPDSVLEGDDNLNTQQYTEWRDRFTLTPGPAIDYAVIEDGLVEDFRRFRVQGVNFDPWNADQLRQNMEKKGGKDKMLECRMGVQTLSDPMKESEVLILAGRLHHDGDPVLTWAVSNVVGRLDAKDNVYPRKDKPEKKIDPAVAMIMALRGAVVVKKPTQPGFLLL